MKDRPVITRMGDADTEEIVGALTDAARIRLMKLGPKAKALIKSRRSELTYNTLDIIQRLSREEQGIVSFGPLEWEKYRGVVFTAEQKEKLEIRPWSEKTLDSCCPFHPRKAIRETHMMIAAPDNATIVRLQKIYQASGTPHFRRYGKEAWYPEEVFAREVAPSFGWHLVLLDIQLKFFEQMMTCDELLKMLPEKYHVTPSALEAMKNLAMFDLTGEYPNRGLYAITSDRIETSDAALGHKRVLVGSTPSEGVSVDFLWEKLRVDWHTGVAAERELEVPLPGNLAFEFPGP